MAIIPLIGFAALAAAGLYVMYRLGPAFDRWSREQYGEDQG
jgi:hypothetical protein